ncbi:MAG: DUF2238 domain-containing protein [Aestuariivirga sp.]|uniref:DUF2238 domain-containing protein n=1 Tax=Aestuariivirga sp. TaxID=2650926 RepID=UPI0025BF07B3|nr:DUF2238 domain-containing protein [Aestuariivirga sp.]MCA3562647.1 DUF2238 domain-containing protein [Aestuariivirga sp.]
MSTEQPAAPGKGLLILLCALYGGIWVWSAWQPGDRLAWLLENILPTALAAALLIGWRRHPLSATSCILLFLFMALHQTGAHYVYSEVPWGRSIGAAFGRQRNDFDRLVHFGFGLLLFLPLREVLQAWLNPSGIKAGLGAIVLILAASALYEIMEMLVVLVVYPETGSAFLGLQGDIWDTQKDMALAFLGSALAFCAAALLSAARGRRQPG